MELLHSKYGIGEIHFMDDNFTQSRDFVEKLCELIIEKGPRIPWACPNGVRLDRIDAELAKLMEKAGCYSLAIGIEFGTDAMLLAIRKNLTTEEIESRIAMLRANTHFRLTGFFILGHPEESETDIRKTIDFALRLPLDRANFFNFTPFAGSPLYYELKESGALSGIDPGALYIHSVAYHPPRVSASRLIHLQQRAHLRFYLRLRILIGLVKEIKGWAQVKVVARRVKHLLTGR
jgi:coproporphyrinogen III oxidase-like Fe-S oxidoreductase